MTEYWQSQARKFCDFCKCWFADNKVSISFHENGKRHKENVQKHISTLSKSSAKEQKQKEKMDDDIKKMEAAAMAAYLKDVQNNADLTSQSINDILTKKDKTPNVSPSSSTAHSPSVNAPIKQPQKKAPVWHEVKQDDGSYFWNTETNETTWDPPDDYLSLAQQEKQKLKEEKEEQSKKKQLQSEKRKAIDMESKAFMNRQKMKALAVKKDEVEEKKSPFNPYGPAPAARPYGSWQTVVTVPEEKVDLQLPKVKELPPPPVVMEPELVQFTEKRVGSLGAGPVEFKKRKINNPKRNMRQKVADDD